MAHALTSSLDESSAQLAADRTVAFYDADPTAYSLGSLDADLSELYPEFVERVTSGGLVLDAGSGSGRDTREFLGRGYRVEAFDASMGMSDLASRLTGVDVKVARFEDWSAPSGRYDGIWCFASLLHVARADLSGVVGRLADALRSGSAALCQLQEG